MTKGKSKIEVEIDGVIYNLTEASEKLGIRKDLITFRCYSKNFPGYKRITKKLWNKKEDTVISEEEPVFNERHQYWYLKDNMWIQVSESSIKNLIGRFKE